MGVSEWLIQRRLRKGVAGGKPDFYGPIVDHAVAAFLRHTTHEERLEMIERAVTATTSGIFDELRKEETLDAVETASVRMASRIEQTMLNVLTSDATDEKLLRGVEGALARLENFSLNMIELWGRKTTPKNLYRFVFTIEMTVMSVVERFADAFTGRRK